MWHFAFWRLLFFNDKLFFYDFFTWLVWPAAMARLYDSHGSHGSHGSLARMARWLALYPDLNNQRFIVIGVWIDF